MGLRISSNIASQSVQKNLREVSSEGKQQLEKLSSGKRINRASDDAAGLAIATNLKAQTQGVRQSVRNANDGISLVQTAEGGLNEVSNILIRLRELSVQAASDTVGENERGYLDKEYQQLTQEVDRIAQSTVFNGASLLDGESEQGTMDFQVGAFAGEQNVIQFEADATDVTISNLGIDSTGVSSKGDAKDSIESIDDAINQVSGQRSELGAVQSRLQSTVSNLEIQALNQEQARSTIEDVDVAAATAELASSNVTKSAGISTLAQANNIPNGALRLIG